ncbi:putative T-complex 11 protein [Helianthus anomalus]
MFDITCSILVLRQTLVMEKMISSHEEMETTIQKCCTELLRILHTVENTGLEEIVEVLSKIADGFDKTNDTTKAESRRLVMARMLRKSVQAEDSVFVKVSRAVYLATRGVVLGGSGNHGRLLAEMALRQVGAAVLTDRVVEAGKVLGVMASVTERVHGPWYDRLIENV